MEKLELEAITKYARRLNDSGGDLSKLSKEERAHLKLLIRKYEIDIELDKMATELSQGFLM